jgi:hypothetical protein
MTCDSERLVRSDRIDLLQRPVEISTGRKP